MSCFLFFSLAPFALVLVALAVLPQWAPRLWSRKAPAILTLLALSAVAFLFIQKGNDAFAEIFCLLFYDYAPFLFLLGSLYVVAGGLKIRLNAQPTPQLNTAILAMFALLASFMGTTGAAMLGIHPLLILNAHRRYKTHTVLFFIFLVCNIGGGFSTVGDPPLFLGFLKGVPFMWPTLNLWKPVALSCGLLLTLYAALDTYFFFKEKPTLRKPFKNTRVIIEGKKQFFLIGAILGALIILPQLPLSVFCLNTLRLIILGACALVSFRITPLKWRQKHHWHWHPLKEVAWIFCALFLTAHAPIQLLAQGKTGPFSSLLSFLETDGLPSQTAYFWTTGLLSAFLDNAPTYLVFLTTTGFDLPTLVAHHGPVLKAISLGAVFMGALTYIGNAPNLLIKTFAEEEYQIPMPNFFLYTFWAALALIPLFFLIPFFL